MLGRLAEGGLQEGSAVAAVVFRLRGHFVSLVEVMVHCKRRRILWTWD